MVKDAYSIISRCNRLRNQEYETKKPDNLGEGETEGFSFGHKLKRCEEEAEEVRESRVTTRRPRSRTGGREVRQLDEKSSHGPLWKLYCV